MKTCMLLLLHMKHPLEIRTKAEAGINKGLCIQRLHCLSLASLLGMNEGCGIPMKFEVWQVIAICCYLNLLPKVTYWKISR